MSLILLTGYPCSGKSTIANILRDKLLQSGFSKVLVIRDEGAGPAFTYNIYEDSNEEKSHRSFLRSEVVKHLNRDTIVILDSANYIKGFRYELFCVAKSSKTTFCVIWCKDTEDNCKKYNSCRGESEKYPTHILEALVMRYESPEAKNRWDSPLIEIPSLNIENGQLQLDEETLNNIVLCIKEGKVLVPNLSTQTQPISSTNFLYELDRLTQEIVRNILEEQKTAQIGDNICVTKGGEMLNLRKLLTCGELAKLRRQYIGYTKTHPLNDFTVIPHLFIAFIQNHQG